MALLVNGEYIDDERFHRAFVELAGGRTPQQVQEQDAGNFQALLQHAESHVLRETLLLRYAAQEALRASPEEIADERRSAWGSAANQSCGVGVTRDMERRILLRKTERHLTRHVPRPERREVESLYRSNPAVFALPERWLVAHIVKLVESEDERAAAEQSLQTAIAELRRGRAFAAVADRHSDCKGSGGALGWIARGSMVAEFESVVFALPRRSVSDIFPTSFGLHIAMVQDHRPAGIQPLDEIRSDLARRMHDDRKAAHLDAVARDLYRRASVEVVAGPRRSVAEGEKVQ